MNPFVLMLCPPYCFVDLCCSSELCTNSFDYNTYRFIFIVHFIAHGLRARKQQHVNGTRRLWYVLYIVHVFLLMSAHHTLYSVPQCNVDQIFPANRLKTIVNSYKRWWVLPRETTVFPHQEVWKMMKQYSSKLDFLLWEFKCITIMIKLWQFGLFIYSWELYSNLSMFSTNMSYKKAFIREGNTLILIYLKGRQHLGYVRNSNMNRLHTVKPTKP